MKINYKGSFGNKHPWVVVDFEKDSCDWYTGLSELVDIELPLDKD